MRDLIERQAAIDAPEEFIKDCNPEHFVGHQKFIEFMDNAEIGSFGNWQFANGFNMGLTAAEVAIKELPSAPRWTPCEERLPEEEKKRYWVCTDTEYQCECRWTNNRFGMGELDEWGWSIFDIPQYSHVTAWMPLPKPWKGET